MTSRLAVLVSAMHRTLTTQTGGQTGSALLISSQGQPPAPCMQDSQKAAVSTGFILGKPTRCERPCCSTQDVRRHMPLHRSSQEHTTSLLTCPCHVQAYLASSSDEEKPSGNAARYQALLSAAGPGKQRTGGKAWSAPKAEEAGSSDDADKAANDQVSSSWQHASHSCLSATAMQCEQSADAAAVDVGC